MRRSCQMLRHWDTGPALRKLTIKDTFKFEASLYHIGEDALTYSCVYLFNCIFEYLLHTGHWHGVLCPFSLGNTQNKAGRGWCVLMSGPSNSRRIHGRYQCPCWQGSNCFQKLVRISLSSPWLTSIIVALHRWCIEADCGRSHSGGAELPSCQF